MTNLAKDLQDENVIDQDTARAIQTLAKIFQGTEQSGHISEAYALNVDYATSTIVAILRKLEAGPPPSSPKTGTA